MPIRPENKARYPRNWPTISGEIRERAGHQCEWPGCGAIQYSVGYWRRADGEWKWLPVDTHEGRGLNADGLPFSFNEARLAAEDWIFYTSKKHIVIVLTVAHLDHTPEHCDPSNLRAWCQRHHLAYDAEHHAATRQRTRRADSGQLQLLEA